MPPLLNCEAAAFGHAAHVGGEVGGGVGRDVGGGEACIVRVVEDRAEVVQAETLGWKGDAVEAEGVARARQSAAVADVVLMVEDRSRPRVEDGSAGMATQIGKELCVANKSDLPAAWRDEKAVEISATTGAGIDDLRRRIVAALDVEPSRDRAGVTNVRHVALATVTEPQPGQWVLSAWQPEN